MGGPCGVAGGLGSLPRVAQVGWGAGASSIGIARNCALLPSPPVVVTSQS